MADAARPAPDATPDQFVAIVDAHAERLGLASYTDLVLENLDLKAKAARRFALVASMTERMVAVAVNLGLNTDQSIDEAHEIATNTARAGNDAVKADERRDDLSAAVGNAVVLARHRERLRAAGRRA